MLARGNDRGKKLKKIPDPKLEPNRGMPGTEWCNKVMVIGVGAGNRIVSTIPISLPAPESNRSPNRGEPGRRSPARVLFPRPDLQGYKLKPKPDDDRGLKLKRILGPRIEPNRGMPGTEWCNKPMVIGVGTGDRNCPHDPDLSPGTRIKQIPKPGGPGKRYPARVLFPLPDFPGYRMADKLERGPGVIPGTVIWINHRKSFAEKNLRPAIVGRLKILVPLHPVRPGTNARKEHMPLNPKFNHTLVHLKSSLVLPLDPLFIKNTKLRGYHSFDRQHLDGQINTTRNQPHIQTIEESSPIAAILLIIKNCSCPSTIVDLPTKYLEHQKIHIGRPLIF
jgi:hypothetical protein